MQKLKGDSRWTLGALPLLAVRSQDALTLLAEGDSVRGHSADLRRVSGLQATLQVNHSDVLVVWPWPSRSCGGPGARRDDDLAGGGGGGGGVGGGGALWGLAGAVGLLGIGVVVEGDIAWRAVQVVAPGRRPTLLRAARQQAALILGADGHARHRRVLQAAEAAGKATLPG